MCQGQTGNHNTLITPELLSLPEWDLGPEDAMQIDLLPNLPTSGGYQTVTTAIDVFSRYLLAYPLIEATALNVAKVIIDIMTKHSYLPTTLITDKGSAFTSTILASRNHCNFGHNTQMRNYKASANYWQT